MNEYDVSAAFQQIEEILIQSMTRNIGKHIKDQEAEGFDWTMWQAEQLKALKQYREENAELFNGYFSTINTDIETALLKANTTGKLSEEQKILKALKKGYKAPKTTNKGVEGAFFKVNNRKLTALVNATKKDMEYAETAVLRMANDKYRKIIFNAQVYANSGAGTVWQAVDMATKDFLSAGINCIEYADGRRVNIASYAEMAIRTANRRAYMLGEGAKRDEWGVHTVLVSQYGACSPTCLPWQGKVYIDDVYSAGKPDGEHPLLSAAIAGGLFHPNCRHTTTTFFEGVNTEPTPMDAGRTEENSALEQKQRYNERQIRKYKRLEIGALTQENIDKYKEKRIYWQQRNNAFIAAHSDVLRRDYARESTRGLTLKHKMALPNPTIELKRTLTAELSKLSEDIKKFDDFEPLVDIWKDPVTVKDYPIKKASIQGKKDYFKGKINDPYTEDAKKPAFVSKMQALNDWELKGLDYEEQLSQITTLETELDKLTPKKFKPKTIEDAYSQERKDKAYWFDEANGGFQAADAYFDPPAKAIHNAATKKEQRGFYTYTEGSGGHNRPLAGFRKPFKEAGNGWESKFYVGPKKVWIDFEGKGDEIRGLTSLIQKSTYDKDVWLQSGQEFQTLEGFLQIPYGTLSSMSDAELSQFVDRKNTVFNFISAAVNEGGGSMFNRKPMKLNIYAPKGSQMLYASDAGAFGKGENEMILQRGGTYKIKKIYWGTDASDMNRKKIFVDMELHPEQGYDLYQQDPKEWTGPKDDYMT